MLSQLIKKQFTIQAGQVSMHQVSLMGIFGFRSFAAAAPAAQVKGKPAQAAA